MNEHEGLYEFPSGTYFVNDEGESGLQRREVKTVDDDKGITIIDFLPGSEWESITSEDLDGGNKVAYEFRFAGDEAVAA